MNAKNTNLFVIFIAMSVVFISGCVQQNPAIDGFDNSVLIEGQKVSLLCSTDFECTLIDKEIPVRCCWRGACDVVDYSLDKYIAVNRQSFESTKYMCPAVVCGPAPGCPTQIINDDYEAKCVDSVCKKVMKQQVTKQTQKLCEAGNGIWREFSDDGEFCHDECNKPENIFCKKAFSYGCDCGSNRCWNGNNCEIDKISQKECEKSGGNLQREGLLGTWTCIHKYTDGGKPCNNSDECLGTCLVGGDGKGYCKYSDSPFGCYTSIEAFKAGEAGICVD